MFSTRLKINYEVLFRKISCSKAVTFLRRLIVEVSSKDKGSVPSRSTSGLWGEKEIMGRVLPKYFGIPLSVCNKYSTPGVHKFSKNSRSHLKILYSRRVI
jgi:hypothetical protein